MLEEDEKDYLRRILARYGDVQPLDGTVSEPAGSGRRLPEVAPDQEIFNEPPPDTRPRPDLDMGPGRYAMDERGPSGKTVTESVSDMMGRPDITPQGGSFDDWRNRTFQPVPSGGSFEEQRARGNVEPEAAAPEIGAPGPDAALASPQLPPIDHPLNSAIAADEQEAAKNTGPDGYSTSKRTIWHKIGAALDGWARGGIFGGIAAVQDPHYFQNQKRRQELARILPEIKAMQTARAGDAGYDAKVAGTADRRQQTALRPVEQRRKELKDAFEKEYKGSLLGLKQKDQEEALRKFEVLQKFRETSQFDKVRLAEQQLKDHLQIAHERNVTSTNNSRILAGNRTAIATMHEDRTDQRLEKKQIYDEARRNMEYRQKKIDGLTKLYNASKKDKELRARIKAEIDTFLAMPPATGEPVQ